MLSVYYQISFAVLLTVVYCAQAEEIHKNLAENNGFADNETRCDWICSVIESDRTEKMRTTTAKRRLIRLIATYEKEVSDKCVKQTSLNSSGNATVHWQIWPSNINYSNFANQMETFLSANLISFLGGSHAERNEIRALCTLKPSRTAATCHKHNTGLSEEDVKDFLAVYPWWRHEQPCNLEDVLEPCINIKKSPKNNSDDLIDLSEQQNVVFCLLFGVLGAIFVYYAPAILCLFSPTMTNEDGVRQITLEGVASPVSFRSLMGNFFFSKSDGTIWHKAKTFSILVVALPLLFLFPVIAFDRHWNGEVRIPLFGIGKTGLFEPFLLVCYSCYVFEAFYISFLTTRSIEGETCFVCRRVLPEVYFCGDHELPGQIAHHLRQQPLILLKCCKLFLLYLGEYLRNCLSFVLPCKLSVSSFLGICLFPFFLLSIPLVVILLLTALSLVALFAVFLTSPVNTIFYCNTIDRDIRHVLLKRCSSTLPECAVKFLEIFTSTLTFFVVVFLLNQDTAAILRILFWITPLLLSEETLPYIACFILVFYYLWSSYSSFTNKYQALALTLYKHHKKSPVATDQEAGAGTLFPGTIVKIPKGLFDLACEQLMPIRVSVCTLLLRVTFILAFVFLVFTLIAENTVSSTPATRALLVFLSGSFPKIIDIFNDGGQKSIETTATERKIHYIIDDYNNRETEQDLEIFTM